MDPILREQDLDQDLDQDQDQEGLFKNQKILINVLNNPLKIY